jgi:hypothetical protein
MNNGGPGIDIGKIMGMMGGLGGLMGGMGGGGTMNDNNSMPNISPVPNIQTSTRPQNLNPSGPLPNKSPALNNDKELSGPKALGIETLLKSLGSDSMASETAGGSKKRGRRKKGNGMEL